MLCALLVVVATGCAQPKSPPADEFENKPWDEQKTLLPSYPKEGNLAPIYVSPAIPFAFFVDRDSVSVGPDGVVRYTLLARSFSAAVNVSHEGIRCQTGEYKVYAFGRSDGIWAQARNPQWLPIKRVQANQQAALADDFFCPVRGRLQTREDALRALARGNQPRY